MNCGRTVFAQLMDFISPHDFRKCVVRHVNPGMFKTFSCWDQFLCMAFAQLSYRESLRDIETCLRAQQRKLYHGGLRGRISRSTLADANEKRPWQIYADLAHLLIAQARPLYAGEQLGVDLEQALYALDATTIDLCLSVFPWAQFRRHKAAVRLHTLLDLHGAIPTFAVVTDGKTHEVNILDQLVLEPGAIYVMDRGYLDFARLFLLHLSLAFFVVRAKNNLKCRRLYSHPVDKSQGIQCDQTVLLTGPRSAQLYREKLRRVRFYDAERDRRLVFLTNNFILPPHTIALIYKLRWRVELFFKWIKQHLRIKAFYGTSPNAVHTQIWIAISVYVLVAIIKKRLGLGHSLYTILQILSVTLFEKMPLFQAFAQHDYTNEHDSALEQLELFDL